MSILETEIVLARDIRENDVIVEDDKHGVVLYIKRIPGFNIDDFHISHTGFWPNITVNAFDKVKRLTEQSRKMYMP